MTSTIKVNTVTTESGSTLTLGGCGKTVALASGASQTGFGRTGTVDWQTGSIKTSTFTAANGEGYFANTNGGAFTMNLPAGVAGAIVAVVDYANTFENNNLTISPNGSDKIGGEANDVALNVDGESVTLVFVDSTEGWITVNASSENIQTLPFVSATGGTETNSPCGNMKIHTFTSPGTFTVNNISSIPERNIVGYMVVAGGGGGGACCAAGGGGAGGYREGRNTPVDNFTASPLVANFPGPNCNAVTLTATSFPIQVGGGGPGAAPGSGSPQSVMGSKGTPSIFSTITSAGGGAGIGGASGPTDINGGSGAGGAHGAAPVGAGSGNTPPTNPAQGTNGGARSTCSPSTTDDGAGGGGGAGGAGVGGPSSSPIIGQGGPGVSSEITGSAVVRAGGGSGGMRNVPGAQSSVPMPGGPGGGGAGGGSSSYPRPLAAASGTDGTCNTGGGGGGATRVTPNPGGSTGAGGNGGSGIVVIRYKFQ